MRTRTMIFASLLVLPLTSIHADTGDNSSASPTNNDSRLAVKEQAVKEQVTKWSLSDKKFIDKAVSGGRAEVEISELAIKKSQTPQVQSFAKQMVKDHTAAAIELKGIAQTKRIPVPTDIDREHQARFKELKKLTGAKFDAAYIDIMQKDHEKTVTLFAAAATDEKLDKKLQEFAAKTLPVIRAHQGHVEALDSKKVSSR